MGDSTSHAGGLPPECPVAPAGLAEVLAAHALAAAVVETVMRLHVAVPDGTPARDRVQPLVAAAAAVEVGAALVAELRANLDGDLTPADVEIVVRHADALYALRPRLGRYVDRLLMAALARRAGLAAAA